MENLDNRSSRREFSFREMQAPAPGIPGSTATSVFHNEQSFRDFIKSNLKRPTVTQEFIQSIKDKIRLV